MKVLWTDSNQINKKSWIVKLKFGKIKLSNQNGPLSLYFHAGSYIKNLCTWSEGFLFSYKFAYKKKNCARTGQALFFCSLHAQNFCAQKKGLYFAKGSYAKNIYA